MSKYSGKCDLWDCVEISGKDTVLFQKDIFLGKHHLLIRSEIDLLKYAPYLVSMAYTAHNRRVIVLQEKPYIDYEEQSTLSMYIDAVKKYYNKCKRNKQEFVPEQCCKELSSFYTKDLLLIIAERMKNKPFKIKIDDLHTPMAECYRKEWYEDLVQAGMSINDAYTWVYGFDRNFKRLQEERKNV